MLICVTVDAEETPLIMLLDGESCLQLLITRTCCRSDKEQLVEEEDDELKEVLDLRKIAVQLLQQEQQNRCVP